MARDMMPGFELYQPDNLTDALDLFDEYEEDAWAIAGGKDSLDWFKDRVKRPSILVDLNGVSELHGIQETGDGGLQIGALTTLTEVANDPLVRERFGLLADAVGKVASPQIRNAGTIGGNICQDARCWYYRDGLPCYRAGGNTCYADTPQGMNREHTLFNASRCVAVTPSDSAPALVALDASVTIQSADDERTVSAQDFFIGPDIDIERMTVVEPGEIVTRITIPGTWAGARFYFEKVADRNAWDFPLVNIAMAARTDGGTISDMRIACGAVECVPRRLGVVEEVMIGSEPSEEMATAAGTAATRGATPLNYNHFKIPLMANLVKRAIRSLA